MQAGATIQTPEPAVDSGWLERYRREGYAGPLRVFSKDQCALIVQHLRHDRTRKKAEWDKGWAAVDPFYEALATRPALLGLLEPILGPDIILWGCSILQREPGKIHPWHTDMESASPEGGFASIWIGLENTSRDSSLCFITRSHAFGVSIQEVRQQRSLARHQATDEQIEAWGREYDPEAAYVEPDMSDGDAIVFDGRLWHTTKNCQAEGGRVALLLQYAAADRPVYRPDLSQLDWPFRFDEGNRPPVIAVKGEADDAVNRVIDPPIYTRPGSKRIFNQVASLPAPLPLKKGEAWTPHRLFRGPSGNHDFLSVHASVLVPGHMPHPPHVHVEEEILVVLDGRGEILTGDSPDPEKADRTPVEPGSFTYYPAYQYHSLMNTGDGPLTYLMFKWPGAPHEVESPLGLQIIHAKDVEPEARPGKAFKVKRLMQGPTGYLGRLRAHVSEMDPGGGYPPHRDRHDVALIPLSGRLLANEEPLEPPGVAYHSGQSPHGLSNPGPAPAKYLVFEFEHPEGPRKRQGRRPWKWKRRRRDHGGGASKGESADRSIIRRLPRLLRKLLPPKRLRRRLFPRR